MKRFFVLSLLIVAALTVVGCGLVSTGEDAAEQASQIADFTVPAGFSPSFGMNIASMAMVGYDHSDGNSHIFLMQAPESADMTAEQLEQEMQNALANAQGQDSPNVVDEEEVPLTIMGQDVTGMVGTGSSNNTSYRILTVPFTGKDGPAILIFQRPEDSWDQAEVDDFIASFR